MSTQHKHRVCFFLDYGSCLWNWNDDIENDGQDLDPEDFLSSKTRSALDSFIREFDAYYGYGLPPYLDFTVEECRRFNQRLRHVFPLIVADLKDAFIVCNDQFELTEDESVLIQFRERGSDFVKEWREKTYLWSQIEWGHQG